MNLKIAECLADAPVEALRSQLTACEFQALLRLPDRNRARSRAHAYILIRDLLVATPTQMEVFYQEDGRPRVHAPGVDISISHTQSRVAVAAVFDENRVGIDIEEFTHEIDTNAFLKFVLTKAEHPEFDKMRASGWTEREAVICIWSAKESFSKCTGYPFRPADLSLHWSEDLDIASVSLQPRLERFLETQGLAPAQVSICRDAARVRAVAVMSSDQEGLKGFSLTYDRRKDPGESIGHT